MPLLRFTFYLLSPVCFIFFSLPGRTQTIQDTAALLDHCLAHPEVAELMAQRNSHEPPAIMNEGMFFHIPELKVGKERVVFYPRPQLFQRAITHFLMFEDFLIRQDRAHLWFRFAGFDRNFNLSFQKVGGKWVRVKG